MKAFVKLELSPTIGWYEIDSHREDDRGRKERVLHTLNVVWVKWKRS